MARFPKSVSPGDPIPTGSEAWNAILGAAHEHRQASRPDAPPRAGGFGGVVWAIGLNDTGADLPKHKPVAATGVGGLDVSGSDPDDDGGPPWQRRPLLTLSEPSAVTDWVGVTLDAIPAGEIGRVAVSGLTLCDVDSASGATWAAPQIGDTAALLGGSTGTVRVLHVPSGVGSQRRCVVYLHERPEVVPPTPGELCEILPSVRRELIGVYAVKTLGNVTDVYQRFQNVTTTADGCQSRGEPYCEVAPSSCGTSRDPLYYCIDGVCWEYYDGLTPTTFDAGPFDTAESCDLGCPGGEPVDTLCCDDVPRVLYLSLSAGGTVTMVYDGSRYWTGSKALTGCTVSFRWDKEDCSMEYSRDGSTWVVASCVALEDGCFTCSPFLTTNYTFAASAIGSPCAFGTITGVLSA